MKRTISIFLAVMTLICALSMFSVTASAADVPSGQIWEGESDLRREYTIDFASSFYLQNNEGYNDETAFPTSERPSMDCSGFWKATENGDRLIITLDVKTEGKKTFYMQLLKSADFGIFDIYYDDKLIADNLDLYCEKASRQFFEFNLGQYDVTPGKHTLTFQVVGKNDLSTNYVFLIDYFEMVGEDGVRRTQKISERDHNYGIISYPEYDVTRYEGEGLTLTAETMALISDQSYYVQIYGKDAAILSYNKHFFWNKVIPGDEMAFELPIDQDGEYEITVSSMAGKDYGMAQWYINDVALGEEMDYYNAEYLCKTFTVTMMLKKGANEISFIATGTNEKSTNYVLSFDYVEIKRIGNYDESAVTTPDVTTTTEPEVTTTPEPEVTTTKPVEVTTPAEVEPTTTPSENTPTTTPAPTTTEPTTSGGCGGLVTLGVVAALVPAAVIIKKKKH
ncbi:MAG: hypothetical protein IJY27_00520 [Clostridia bacterium]|nr:hypothetical protein [Clostridia bacterium]